MAIQFSIIIQLTIIALFMIKFVDNKDYSNSSEKDQHCIHETYDKKSFCKCTRDYVGLGDDDDDDDDEDTPGGIFYKCCEKHINDDCRHELRVLAGPVDNGECVKPLGKIQDCTLEKVEELNGSTGLRCSMILIQTVTLMTLAFITRRQD